MGKSEGIRVFLRIRPPSADIPRPLNSTNTNNSINNNNNNNNNQTPTYAVEHTFDRSIVRFHVDRRTEADVVNNTAEDYRFVFRRAFEPNATQEEVFNTVAKDCVLAAVDGYNSTIFAYGQTGSGKTFSITGGTESYNDRGIIPRALALIYEEIARRQLQEESVCNITISYLQIYNDKGQDLLNHGRDARKLEELPQVTVHESEEEVVLKGLAQHSAPTTEAALNLLFLGDTNRLYCETPMNKTSSRSHCVFTVYIETRPHGGAGATVRRSKLNLVDLAGSERVSKTGVRGTVLTEAKHINLSLHYLEQVIMALSEQASGKREHVPFRNSFMTMVLRDSLGSNCRTSMLATAHPSLDQLPETISTCRFAQRVALIRQEARINEEIDPHLLVRRLKMELQQLRDQLAFYTKDGGGAPDRVLSDDEKLRCSEMVERYVADTAGDARMEGFDGDLARIYYCFDIMKRMLTGNGNNSNSNTTNNNINKIKSVLGGGVSSPTGSPAFSSESSQQQQQQIEAYISRIDALEMSLQQKENEMNMLFDVLQRTQRPRFNAETQTGLSTNDDHHHLTPSSQPAAMTAIGSMLQGISTSQSLPLGNGPYSSSSNVNIDRNPLTTSTSSSSITTTITPASQLIRRALPEHLAPAQAAAVDEFFRKQQQLNEVYDLSALTDADLLQDRATAFEAFKRSYRQCTKMEENKRELKGRYETCKATARQLNETVDRIKQVKAHIQRLRAERAMQGVDEVDETERAALEELTTQKNAYNELAESLRRQKEAIDAMHIFMKRAQEQLTKDFEDWLQIRQKQLTMATGGGSGVVGNMQNKQVNGSENMSGNNNNNNNNNTNNSGAQTLMSSSLRSQSSQSNEQQQQQQQQQLPLQQKQQQQQQQPLGRVAMGIPPELPPLREEKMGSARTWSAGHAMNIMINNSSSSTNSNSNNTHHNNNNSSVDGVWQLGSTLNSSSSNNAGLNPAERIPPHPATAPSSMMSTGQERLIPPVTDRVSSLSRAPLSLPSNMNAWMTSGNGTGNISYSNSNHNRNSNNNNNNNNNNNSSVIASMSTLGNTGGQSHVPNPYAPEHHSTGDAAADKQLAALYKARDAMRLQFQS